jgi:uncharacterized coiled-coil protein SlyX
MMETRRANLDAQVTTLNDMIAGFWVEMEMLEGQISDMWTQYDTIALSISTMANPDRIARAENDMQRLDEDIQEMYR